MDLSLEQVANNAVIKTELFGYFVGGSILHMNHI